MSRYLFILAVLFFSSCGNSKKESMANRPAKINSFSLNNLPPVKLGNPKVFAALKPVAVKVTKPSLFQSTFNQIKAKTPTPQKALKPIIVDIGSNGMPYPKTVIGKGKIIELTGFEIIKAKASAAKDHNPANFSFYKTLQGLKHNNVKCLMEDKWGNLWFGTNGGGLGFYDGKNFNFLSEAEGLPNNYVSSIIEDSEGRIWIGSQGGGVCYYDGKELVQFANENGLGNDFVTCIFEDKNKTIWIGTYGGGVIEYKANKLTRYSTLEGLPSDNIICIYQDKNGNMWFGTDDEGAVKFNGKSFACYTSLCGMGGNSIWSIVEDNTGALWFGTNGQGITRFDGTYFTIYTKQNGLSSDLVLHLSIDSLSSKKNCLWIATYGGGVCYFDGTTFKKYDEEDGLSSNFIWSILRDKSHNMWLASDGGGLCRYDGNYFTNYTEKEGLSNNAVTSITQDKKGNIWFGTYGGGACCYNGLSFSNFTEKEGFPNNFIWSVLEDSKGNLWFGSNGTGASYLKGDTVYNFTKTEGLANDVVWSIMEDNKQNIWFGTYGGGACRFNGKAFEYFTEKEGLSNNFIYTIKQDSKGNIWFGTDGAGVSCFDGKTFRGITDKEGLTNNIVQCIFEDKMGNMWFGTQQGLNYYNGASLIQLTEHDGLAGNSVLNILQDTNGNLWIGTRNGLSKISASKLEEFNNRFKPGNKTELVNFNPLKEALFYNYNYDDGFLGLTCKRNSVYEDKEGKIWWGTDMLMCHDPSKNYIYTKAPGVKIINVKLYGENIKWDCLGKNKGKINDTLLSNGILLSGIKFDSVSTIYELPENLSLPYNNNNISFNFVGVHLQNRNHIKYQFQLEGYDPGWSSITQETESHYGNLPSGNYSFKVKAMNQSGNWSPPFEYKFTVRPPWWQTWWFRISCIITGSLLIWYYIKRREAKLIKEKETLEQVVIERTAEVVREKRIIEEQKIVVEEQKHLIEEKHKEITDSINYAERIQKSFLATDELLNENLKEHFVFFKPKDVVSGDFYWASKLNNGNFVYVIADSTGHGVPGAIMSILNITSLEKSIETCNEPDDILNETRKIIIERLKKDGSPEGGKDGMDACLVVLEKNMVSLSYAAANNPLWVVRDKELIELKPDKMPVGKHDRDNVPFTLHRFELISGDMVYSFTDGMPDQFGGPKGKKYLYKQLKEFLVSVSDLSVNEQHQKLQQEFEIWKGNLEQVDDVTLFGLRIK